MNESKEKRGDAGVEVHIQECKRPRGCLTFFMSHNVEKRLNNSYSVFFSSRGEEREKHTSVVIRLTDL